MHLAKVDVSICTEKILDSQISADIIQDFVLAYVGLQLPSNQLKKKKIMERPSISKETASDQSVRHKNSTELSSRKHCPAEECNPH